MFVNENLSVNEIWFSLFQIIVGILFWLQYVNMHFKSSQSEFWDNFPTKTPWRLLFLKYYNIQIHRKISLFFHFQVALSRNQELRIYPYLNELWENESKIVATLMFFFDLEFHNWKCTSVHHHSFCMQYPERCENFPVKSGL